MGSWDPDPQNSLRDRRGCGPELGDPSEGQQVWGPQFASGTGGGSSHLEQMETFHKEMSPASSRSAQALTTPSSAVASGTVHIIPAGQHRGQHHTGRGHLSPCLGETQSLFPSRQVVKSLAVISER